MHIGEAQNTTVAKGIRCALVIGKKKEHTNADQIERILCSGVPEFASGGVELLHGGS